MNILEFNDWCLNKVKNLKVPKFPARPTSAINNYPIQMTLKIPVNLITGFDITNSGKCTVTGFPDESLSKVKNLVTNLDPTVATTKGNKSSLFGQHVHILGQKNPDQPHLSIPTQLPEVDIDEFNIRFAVGMMTKKVDGVFAFDSDLRFLRNLQKTTDDRVAATFAIGPTGTSKYNKEFTIYYNPLFFAQAAFMDHLAYAAGIQGHENFPVKNGTYWTLGYLMCHELMHYRMGHFNEEKKKTYKEMMLPRKIRTLHKESNPIIMEGCAVSELKEFQETIINSRLNEMLGWGPVDGGISSDPKAVKVNPKQRSENLYNIRYALSVSKKLKVGQEIRLVITQDGLDPVAIREKYFEAQGFKGTKLVESGKDPVVTYYGLGDMPDFAEIGLLLSKAFAVTNNYKDYHRAMKGKPFWEVGDIVQPKGKKTPHVVTKVSDPDANGHQDIEMYPIKMTTDQIMQELQGGK